MSARRPAFGLFQLLIALAFILVLIAMLLPAVQKTREAAARMQSQNNLKQIALSLHNYADANLRLPAGEDANHFGTLAYLLPYVEQDAVYRRIDFKKSVDDEDNAAMRAVRIKVFMSPLDDKIEANRKWGATSYMAVAGSNPALKDNNGILYRESRTRFPDITDGTSNTLLTIETLVGDGSKTAITPARQHIRLKANALKDIKDSAGVDDWKDGKNIAADRGGSWMDGRFLQSTVALNRTFNAEEPDVDCGGDGGLAGPRGLRQGFNVGMADGSVRFISGTAQLSSLKALATRSGGEVINDF
ncbi:MAG: DUF1559 domain-containing protein [Gemmataceae bacterium]